MVIVSLHIFVAEHFDVDMLINVIETSLICVQRVAKLREVILAHEWFELW